MTVEIKAELDKISDQIKEQGEKALAEAKKAGDMSLETKTKVDEMLVKQGELQARLQEAEQKLDRRAVGDQEGAKSAGQQLVESQDFKDYVAKGDYRKGFNFPTKAVINVTTTNAGANVAQRWRQRWWSSH
jgi:hypothetical protein